MNFIKIASMFISLTVIWELFIPIVWSAGFLCERVENRKYHSENFKKSDVSIRLFRRYRGYYEIDMAKAFHATRSDWSYICDAKYIDRVHQLGWKFQGTMNSIVNSLGYALRDEKGKPVLDHFKKPGRYVADLKKEAYINWFSEKVEKWIGFGVDSMQQDEPNGLGHWSIDEAVSFYRKIHKIIDKEAGRHLPKSLNLNWNGSVLGGRGEPITSLFDYGMAEVKKNLIGPKFFWKASRDAISRDQDLIYTSGEDLGVDLYRKVIATCYANGMLFIVPWDQYAGVEKKRVFSRPDDLADLYGFVRANSSLLDGYEEVAVAGYQFSDTKRNGISPILIENNSRVSSWVRVLPRDKKAPVVIHLVDWGEIDKTIQLKLKTSDFFNGEPILVKMLVPAKYNFLDHKKAQIENDYSNLSVKVNISIQRANGYTLIDLPPINPWGMLLVLPLQKGEKR